ncbi:MAG: metallopeptidase family protein [Planctomycetota bacterium]
MRPADRQRFDALLDGVLASLPAQLRALLDEVPLIVQDAPDEAVLQTLDPPLELEPGEDPAESLCGLHIGIANTERSVEDGAVLPPTVYLFRQGILRLVGGAGAGDETLAKEIRITLLHELGHQFGLDEDDLENLGYG